MKCRVCGAEFLRRRDEFLEAQARAEASLANEVRIDNAWLGRGARPSLTVAQLLKRSGRMLIVYVAVIGVVVGELVGGNTGLGYLLIYGQGQGNTAMVFVTIILLTLIGIVAYMAVALAEARVLHYLPRAQHYTV